MITLLIDSHGLGYRAYHSMGSLDSGIAFGFLTTVLNLGERYRTNRFVFCWEGGGSKRKAIFPAYKSGRDDKTPEEKLKRAAVHLQFDALRKEILPALGFNNCPVQHGYEADDLIASMVIDYFVTPFVVVSSDHDLFQLLQYHNCRGQHLLSSGKMMNAGQFMANFRVPAREWVSVKAIAGCDGDGVPGVSGVGETTAIRYLMNELPPTSKKVQAIVHNGYLIHRNYKLVRLPFPGVAEIQLKEDRFDEQVVLQTFGDLGFHSFTAEKQAARWRQFCKGW